MGMKMVLELPIARIVACLSARFLDELALVFQRIKDNPHQFPCVEGDVHRAILSHFTYVVYFLWQDAEKVRRLRSLPSPKRLRAGRSLRSEAQRTEAYASPGDLFEHPVLYCPVVRDLRANEIVACR